MMPMGWSSQTTVEFVMDLWDNQREAVLDRLIKLRVKLQGKGGLKQPLLSTLEKCPDPDFHLAGLFLKEHINLFIEAIRRMD